MDKRHANQERIIRRVKGLLKLAEDNSNIEESQSAFMQAQQMMVKYGVDRAEVVANEQHKEILTKAATTYKRLYWWEKMLAGIISRNFRCSWYYSGKYVEGSVQMKRSIVFVGYETDVVLATEMYQLAISAVKFYTKKFMKVVNPRGNRKGSDRVKNDYMRGFIDGLAMKFEEQVKAEAWGLVVVVPEAVVSKTKEITKGGKALSFYVPNTTTSEHYDQGYHEGQAIDYTRSSIDD